MFRLRLGVVFSVLMTMCLLCFSFIKSLPDNKLHLIFCDVGQGDALYIITPAGRDILIDGGPNSKILSCLSRHMPFWDRTIDLVIYTHAQKDHIGGLSEVIKRYSIGYIVSSGVIGTSEEYKKLEKEINKLGIAKKQISQSNSISMGNTQLLSVWPTAEFIAQNSSENSSLASTNLEDNILGVSVSRDLNDFSVVLLLSYGSFNALLTGDSDIKTQNIYTHLVSVPDSQIEVLKVPHHGSRSGLSAKFLESITENQTNQSSLAVISVGKNSYGHPAAEIIDLLISQGFKVKRTDQEGDIEVVSDGKNWQVVEK